MASARAMQGDFSGYEYVEHLRGRWRMVAAACTLAALLAAVVTIAMPKQYIATARLVIEPPAGSDARTPMVISPQYLESLRTYEHFVSADRLFLQAVDRFRLREKSPNRSIEEWKRKVLKVSLVRNTKILDVAVTLDHAKTAQAMAQFLAEGAILLSRALNREADQELAREAQAQLDRAREDFEKAEAAWSKLVRTAPMDSLESEISALKFQRSRIDATLLTAEMHAVDPGAGPQDKARVELLRKQRETQLQSLAKANALLAERSALHEQADQQRKSAQAIYNNAKRQYEDARALAGFRGDRLRLIDPGIVPEQPSGPSLRLHVLAAVLFAVAASAGYLTLQYGLQAARKRVTEPAYGSGRARDD